ncbi:MAG: rod shape-determining protein [Bacteroidales bacterium]|nr:rod shape-determining protein [Bacteroidales bacterium]MCF8454514.1 rod shape-determining protein [Bacteroidales bacterium]
MKLLKFASIDIGSNAVRLLFVNVMEDGGASTLKKSSIIRMPVRLGDPVFENHIIPKNKMEMLADTMSAFKLLMKVENVVAYRACATSAMREATNNVEVIDFVKKQSGMDIEIIDGKDEAQIILQSNFASNTDINSTYIYVDVGGGSTEITVLSNNEVVSSHSFNIGTLRLLKKKVSKKEKEDMKQLMNELGSRYRKAILIGTGGNINKYFKLSGKKEGKPLSYYHLLELFDSIRSLTYNDRMKELGLNPDRADVIIPAGEIFLNIMKWSNLKNIHIPKTGLSDGIIKQLYFEYQKESKQSAVSSKQLAMDKSATSNE